MKFKKKQQKPQEAEPAEEPKKAPPPKVPLLSLLLRFASPTDKLLMLLGTLCAIANGVGLPLMTIVFGDVIDAFGRYPLSISQQEFDDKVRVGCLWFLIIGIAVWVLSYFQLSLWMAAGENQTKRIRQLYFEAILRQEVEFFDTHETGDLTSRLMTDTVAIQDGLSDKVGLSFQFITTFVAGFVIGFTKGWRLALVLSCVFPILGAASFAMTKLLAAGASDQSDAYAQAGAVAQQVLSAMRTVTSFNGQSREIERYVEKLKLAERFGIKKGINNGLSIGVVFGLIFACYALAFYYGSTLVIDGIMSGGSVLNVFFAIIIGAFSLGNAGPGIVALGTAQGSAYKVFEIIGRKSAIDSSSEDGKKLDSVQGDIEFQGIEFAYPTRKDVTTLKNFNLKVPRGHTVALVGASGSGKSTIVKLLERFYDPIQGRILLDNVPITELNVKWLRQQIGIVSQEPVLFQSTLRENILFGLPRHVYLSKTAGELDKMMEDACKMANAWDFIQKLPQKINTMVGEAGSTLSGGQKQRIAIARAIISNPKILLLDEATSALDTASESIVQESLDRARAGRTTIVIAHRLSTIREANTIVVMEQGEILEFGTHQELISAQKAYYHLVKTQEMKMRNEDIKQVTKLEQPKSEKVALVKPEATAVEMEHSDEPRKSIKVHPEAESKKSKNMSYGRLFKMNAPEWPLMLVGATAASLNGLVMPCFSLVFSNILNVFFDPDPAVVRDRSNFWAGMFMVLAAAAFISNFLQTSLFSRSGEKLTTRIRTLCFETLVRQEIGYFDEEEHSSGVLLTRLSEDAGQIKGLTGQLLAAIVQNMASVVSGLVIAFYYGWQLTLVILGGIPIVGVAGFLQLKVLAGFGEKAKKAYNEAGNVAVEAIQNVRTVVMLSKEQHFVGEYENALKIPHNVAVKGAYLASFGFGFSQGSIFFIYAAAFYYGSRLIVWGLYNTSDTLKVLFAIIFSAMAAGQSKRKKNCHICTQFRNSQVAANSVFDILDRPSKIDYTTRKGEKPAASNVKGNVNVSGAHFSYPTRPDLPVLTGMNCSAAQGQTIALVGPSGCGKSTVIALLERFYHVTSGSVELDNLDVQSWELNHLREQMALVGQEPILFNVSIRDNIAYGGVGPATSEDIEAVARMANIHEFVMTLPQGYDTLVGEKGGQLSGGQKQRIAIARALMRKPALLLLDEATSALDSESEKVVQEALDLASKGRTTITIAHRLSTIQNADQIFVVQNGKVIEHGKHFELLDLRGVYFELVNQQNLSNVRSE